MEERRIPSLLLRIVFKQVQELMGEKSLSMLLRQGGPSDYLTTPPPADESPSITVQEYATLLAHIYEIIGPRHLYAVRARDPPPAPGPLHAGRGGPQALAGEQADGAVRQPPPSAGRESWWANCSEGPFQLTRRWRQPRFS